MSRSKYRVIINGNVMPECDRREVVQGLANLFNSRASAMENLLTGNSVPLKKQYDKDQAEIICNNIRKAGAQCSIEEIPETEIATESTADESSASDEEPRQSSKEKLQVLLMRFVKSNTDYYQQQFSKFGNPLKPAFKITWHWPAFFYFFFWALYRKMWLWAVIHAIGGTGLMLWVSPGFVYLVWVFIWPLLANYLYFRVAATAVNQVMEYPQAEQHYLDKGGVSKRAVWGGILIALVSTMLVSNYVTTRFLAEYGEQIQDVLPGSGTQIRGNGSMLKDVAEKSRLARTSLILSVLATSFKILLLTDNAQHTQSTQTQPVISIFIDRLNTGEINDGWGNEIRIEQQVDRYVLISAGPDRIFKTDDDVLQPIIIP
ncbi:DUF2628 domain-containing protein [Candidatus Spongiihabitans sp.]|uniref:DUF2628 domain-containing protein n=1 Tax=Candidatus Spongiihabitans sp. TaxID=3101308 RepID=UPI003C6F5206